MSEPVAYSYKVTPDNPPWSDETPAFDAHESVTFEHPKERFKNCPGVKAVNVTPLHTDD